VIFTLAKQLADDLALVGLELQPAKSKTYITKHLRDERWDELRGDVCNGTIEDDEGITHFGISACNIPIGTEGFVKTYLNQKKDGILKGYDTIINLLLILEFGHILTSQRGKCYGSLSTFACSLQEITGCVIFVLTTQKSLQQQLIQEFLSCYKHALG
jgi:hypothetical protein